MASTKVANNWARFAALAPAVQAAVLKANEQNADEFMGLVGRIIPKGADAGPGNERLVDTLAKEPSRQGYGTAVAVGGPEAKFPANLEFGHMLAGGEGNRLAATGRHIPAKPFWYPALRMLKKKFRDRRSRLARAAIKQAAGG